MNTTRELRSAAHAVATIPNGQSQSDTIDLSDYVITGLDIPSAWTAAAITFLASPSRSGTFAPVYDDAGAEVMIPSASVAASRAIVNKPVLEQLAALRYVKLRSGTAATPVNQGGARTIVVRRKT